MKFEEGNLVCLKTGGPLMTVEKINEMHEMPEIINCVWMIKGIVHRDAFHKNHLNKLQLIEE